ncbi:WD40-repeat-containing domain protein [Hyaloraphidium curvatum]|nr:WD40-repeat-containing domain protein [Hyaloraphidium curvatum]
MDDRRMDGRMDPRMDERRGDVRMEERRGEDRRYDERRVDDRRGSDWREPEYGRVRELRDKSRDRRWNPEARDNRDPRAYADDRGRRQYDERDYREPQREREYDRRQQYDDRGYQHGSQPAYDDRQQRRDGDRYASPAPSHGSGGVPTGRPRGSSRDRNEQRRRSKSRSPTRVSLPFANGTADGPPPFSPQVPGSARPASDVPVAKQIEAKEAEKSELVRRRAALAVEMGALSTRITELDAEITNLYFLQGQRGGSVPAGEQVLSPGSSVRTLAANGDAGEADDGKRKRKKAAEAAEPGDLTADGDSEPRARPKKAARPAPADPTDDVVEEVEPAPASAAPKPFQPLSKKQQLKLSKPKTDMTTGVFGRVPRALLRCPKADMLVASSLDGSICFLDTNKGLPRIRIRDTLRRADLNNLPWAEDMDFIGLDLIAIAAAPKTTKNGNTITSPYKLGILQIPADLDQPTFSTMLYEPDVQPHNKDKSISCVTSPSFVFDGSDVDGIRFATGGTDRQVYLWNLRELQQGNPVPGKGMAKCSARLLNFGHGASVSDLKWDGRNQRLYSASSGELIAFDMNGERKVNTCKLDSAISGLCLSAASPDLLLVTLNSPQTKNNALFDTRKNEVVLRFGTPEPSGKANGHYRSALSPSGRLVASGTMYVGDTGGPVINCVWDLRWTGTRQNEPAARVKSMHKNAMQRFVWTSDQQFFSTSTGDGIECVEFATASG